MKNTEYYLTESPDIHNRYRGNVNHLKSLIIVNYTSTYLALRLIPGSLSVLLSILTIFLKIILILFHIFQVGRHQLMYSRGVHLLLFLTLAYPVLVGVKTCLVLQLILYNNLF